MSGFSALKAPSIAEFQALAEAAFAGLPEEFRALCENIVIHVEDFAADDVLQAMGSADPFELTGLYEGVDVTAKSIADPMEAPDHVFLFRRPLLDEWADNGEITLEELIRHVLIHEIGHHFGLSDEAMHAVEESA